jgi:hypothetical protein
MLADDADAPSARLVIRFGSDARNIPRFAGWLFGRSRKRRVTCLNLVVQDLEGHPVGNFDPAATVTQLRLAPGTYVVEASNGCQHRTYTMALGAGTSFELRVDGFEPSGAWLLAAE